MSNSEKLTLGLNWLQHIGYDPDWTTEEFLQAIHREELSHEAREAVAAALKAGGLALINEATALERDDHSLVA